MHLTFRHAEWILDSSTTLDGACAVRPVYQFDTVTGARKAVEVVSACVRVGKALLGFMWIQVARRDVNVMRERLGQNLTQDLQPP